MAGLPGLGQAEKNSSFWPNLGFSLQLCFPYPCEYGATVTKLGSALLIATVASFLNSFSFSVRKAILISLWSSYCANSTKV